MICSAEDTQQIAVFSWDFRPNGTYFLNTKCFQNNERTIQILLRVETATVIYILLKLHAIHIAKLYSIEFDCITKLQIYSTLLQTTINHCALTRFSISKGSLMPNTCPTTENHETRYFSTGILPRATEVPSLLRSSFIHSLVPQGCSVYHGRPSSGCSYS